MNIPEGIKSFKYYKLGRRLVRVGYNDDGDPAVSQVTEIETKSLIIDNTFLYKIMFQDPDDLEEIDEHSFAELALQKGIKVR